VPEIAAFWQTIANQYKFLYERESRMLAESNEKDAAKSG
jgi:hypothetical protein